MAGKNINFHKQPVEGVGCPVEQVELLGKGNPNEKCLREAKLISIDLNLMSTQFVPSLLLFFLLQFPFSLKIFFFVFSIFFFAVTLLFLNAAPLGMPRVLLALREWA